jgi:hypothetical protein
LIIGSMSAVSRRPFGADQVRVEMPPSPAAAPISKLTTWALTSQSSSSPWGTRSCRPIWLAMEPVGVKTAASLPKSAAASASRALTDGSSPYTSSPTSALVMAASMAGVGLVTVSERRSTIMGRP